MKTIIAAVTKDWDPMTCKRPWRLTTNYQADNLFWRLVAEVRGYVGLVLASAKGASNGKP